MRYGRSGVVRRIRMNRRNALRAEKKYLSYEDSKTINFTGRHTRHNLSMWFFYLIVLTIVTFCIRKTLRGSRRATKILKRK
jgi:hypothetical protein